MLEMRVQPAQHSVGGIDFIIADWGSCMSRLGNPLHIVIATVPLSFAPILPTIFTDPDRRASSRRKVPIATNDDGQFGDPRYLALVMSRDLDNSSFNQIAAGERPFTGPKAMTPR
jgi:hypothetical protein